MIPKYYFHPSNHSSSSSIVSNRCTSIFQAVGNIYQRRQGNTFVVVASFYAADGAVAEVYSFG